MNAKQCPYCHEFSYSAYLDAKWICPKCGKDISDVKFVPAEEDSEPADH